MWDGRYVPPLKDANFAEYEYDESVLSVCHGNICMSSMAEFIFKKMVGTSDLRPRVIGKGLRQDRSPEFRRKKE